MDILDISFYIAISPTLKVQMVTVWLKSPTSLYNVSMGKCIPNSNLETASSKFCENQLYITYQETL